MAFTEDLTLLYEANASAENAVAMAKYMKEHFVFYGIRTDKRRKLHTQAAEDNKADIKEHAREVALTLYNKPQREFHYSAIEVLINSLKNNYLPADITLIEHLLVTHSWWDNVDIISKYLLGGYLQQYPSETEKVISRFSASENMWLNRAAILFQLGYKKATSAAVLFRECEKHRESKEFFIQKAIGWALREYAKTDAEAVKTFVSTAHLKPLSTREALKNL